MVELVEPSNPNRYHIRVPVVDVPVRYKYRYRYGIPCQKTSSVVKHESVKGQSQGDQAATLSTHNHAISCKCDLGVTIFRLWNSCLSFLSDPVLHFAKGQHSVRISFPLTSHDNNDRFFAKCKDTTSRKMNAPTFLLVTAFLVVACMLSVSFAACNCCDPSTRPDGQDGSPICIEGSTCCSDGNWACNEGDGSSTCIREGETCCCDLSKRPDGSNGGTVCIEGSSCCSDGSWACNEGDGSSTCTRDGSVCRTQSKQDQRTGVRGFVAELFGRRKCRFK